MQNAVKIQYHTEIAKVKFTLYLSAYAICYTVLVMVTSYNSC